VCNKESITYRRACLKDLQNIQEFVDFWLSGRAVKIGGGNDYFVSRSQQKGYLKNTIVLLAEMKGEIVGWAVKGRNNVLIHLLVAADYRGKGIGKKMLERLNPDVIRSKSDQMTGDPVGFYEKNGYMVFNANTKVGKKSNIDLMIKRAQPNEKPT